MGEIADGLINGDFDFYTGEYLGRGFGIPRTKNNSLEWEKRSFTQSKAIAFKGVAKYVHKRLGLTDCQSVVNEYMPRTDKSLKQKCVLIQKDFGAFVNFINSKTKK